MLTYLRYALAMFCFAASVGCLLLCWRSMSYHEMKTGRSVFTAYSPVVIEWKRGIVRTALLNHDSGDPFPVGWDAFGYEMPEALRKGLDTELERDGRFSFDAGDIQLPLWYPALIFALAGVGVLRFRRQFSIRSALICVSVVALLLGMAVIL